mmetsp:Transcript_63821/g.118620  ORF Transcript_63821/g.118620 Transcript_63821/m.118620 type:complete len:154 (-) Transcript_63821:941-1402(-)
MPGLAVPTLWLLCRLRGAEEGLDGVVLNDSVAARCGASRDRTGGGTVGGTVLGLHTPADAGLWRTRLAAGSADGCAGCDFGTDGLLAVGGLVGTDGGFGARNLPADLGVAEGEEVLLCDDSAPRLLSLGVLVSLEESISWKMKLNSVRWHVQG